MNSSAPASRAARTASSKREAGPAGEDVVAHRAAEQEVLLQHHAEAPAQVAQVDLAQVVPSIFTKPE